jgi:hypothetical protein
MGFSPSHDPSGTLQLVAVIYSGTTGTLDGGGLVLMILYDQGCRAGAQGPSGFFSDMAREEAWRHSKSGSKAS